MAQPKYERCSIALSLYLGDQVTSAANNGLLYSAQERLHALNLARQRVFLQLLGMGESILTDLFPEYLAVAHKRLSPKDLDVKSVYRIYGNATLFYPTPEVQAMDAESNPYSVWHFSRHNSFTEFSDKIQVNGMQSLTYALMQYLRQPTFIEVGGADFFEPEILEETIIREAHAILTGSRGDYPAEVSQAQADIVETQGSVSIQRQSNGRRGEIHYGSYAEALQGIRDMLMADFNRYATIVDADKGSILIDCSQVTDAVVDSDVQIRIPMAAGDVILRSKGQTSRAKQYIDTLTESYGFNPEDADYSINDISTLQATINAALSGESIEIQAGSYTLNSTITMKSGVMVYAGQDVTIESGIGDGEMFEDNGDNDSIKWFGKCIIKAGISKVFAQTHDSVVFLQCHSIDTENINAVYQSAGFMFIKCEKAGCLNRLAESDTQGKGIMADVGTGSTSGSILFADTQYEGAEYTLLNMTATKKFGNPEAMLELFGAVATRFIAGNVMLVTDDLVFSTENAQEVPEMVLSNSRFAGEFIRVFDPVGIELIGVSGTDKLIEQDAVSFSGSGLLVQDIYISKQITN